MVKKVLELNFIHLTVSFKRLSFSERALLCVHTCAHVWVPASAHLFVCRVVFQPPPIILKKIVLVYVAGRKEHLGEVLCHILWRWKWGRVESCSSQGWSCYSACAYSSSMRRCQTHQGAVLWPADRLAGKAKLLCWLEGDMLLYSLVEFLGATRSLIIAHICLQWTCSFLLCV